ncbi:MAG TPA: hypothetical protein DDZ51_08510 [Planctomycetaceae bacterium]|nr:hypothetical protein [Planctomycetaceae bacterium]
MLRSFLLSMVAIICASTAHAGILSSLLTINGQVDHIRTTTSPVGRAFHSGNILAGPAAGDTVFGFILSNQSQNDIVESENPFNPEAPIAGGGVTSNLSANQFIAAVFAGTLVQLDTNLLGLVSTPGFNLSNVLSTDFAAELALAPDALVAVLSGTYAGGVNAMVSTEATRITRGGVNDLNVALNSTNSSVELLAGFGRMENFFSATTGLLSQQRAGLDVLANFSGISEFKDLRVSPLPTVFPFNIVGAQIALDNTFVSADFSSTSGWNLNSTASDIRINGTPEPTSIAIFAMLAVGGGVQTFRRRLRSSVTV